MAWSEQFKNFFQGSGQGGSSKFRSRLIILVILGAGLILFNSFFSTSNRSPDPVNYTPGVSDEQRYEQHRDRDLTAMLNQIRGVSNVQVFLTMEDAGRIEIVTDSERSDRQTIEEDSGGGKREINEVTLRENHVILRDAQGREMPLVVQEIAPRYRGVLVVADGVENPAVQAMVTEAVRSALGLPYHRITVLPRGN